MSLLDVIKKLEEKITFKKEATVGGVKFEISLLTYEQDQFISAIPEEGDNPLSYYEKSRAKILSYAIQSIDDEVIPDIVEIKVGDKTETIEKALYVRNEIINKIPPTMMERLFEIYIDFKDEIDTQLNGAVEYKWYKTPEQRRKEQLEDKKKEEAQESKKEESPEIKQASSEESPIVFTKIEEKEESDQV